tara:strand:+ start:132 stop:611 length:480 start_codon:yes stop_codon:yes gene_type:complete
MSDTKISFDSLKSRFSGRVAFSPNVETVAITNVTALRVESAEGTVQETIVLTTDLGYICIWSPLGGNLLQQKKYQERANTVAPVLTGLYAAGNLQSQAASLKHPGCEDFLFSYELPVPATATIEFSDSMPFWPAGVEMDCLPVGQERPVLIVTQFKLVD